MTKIMHVIIGLERGGAEQSLLRLIKSHAGDPNFHHQVVSLTSIGALGRSLLDMGMQVEALDLQGIWSVPRVVVKLRRIMRRERPDIVQCWMYHADLIGGLCARSIGIRSVLWGVRNSHLDGGGKPVKRAIRRLCAKLSTVIPSRIVCVAEAARDVHRGVGYDGSRMLVIPNGYDTGKYAPSDAARARVRAEFGFERGDLVIGSVGRYTPAKDHAGFVDAAAKVVSLRPDTKFLLIGRDVDSRNQVISSLLSERGLSQHVVLAGERSDVCDCLCAMDVFCLHSKTEGFPNVLGEAMATALPCVSTDVGDAAVLLGHTGILVPSGGEVSEGLLQMLRLTRDVRQDLGVAARERIKSTYTLNRTTEKYESLYRSLVSSDKGLA